MDWNKYPNFTKKEFDCKATGENEMQPEFMEKLQTLRALYGKPMRITSGFRSTRHPNEVNKLNPGAHTKGLACDIAVQGADALVLIKLALEVGFTGIGVNQKGTSRFIHLDTIKGDPAFPRPTIWSY